MAFPNYQTWGQVLETFDLTLEEIELFPNLTLQKMPQLLKEHLLFVVKNTPYNVSEAAICESIIFPFLIEIYKNFDDTLMLWSHLALSYNDNLFGTPDYLVTKKTKHGKMVMSSPLLAVVEAKKDDFSLGWGQCAAEMVAMQKLNKNTNIPIYGIVSNGISWEFGVLQHQIFSKNMGSEGFSMTNLDRLYSFIYHVIEICAQNAQQF